MAVRVGMKVKMTDNYVDVWMRVMTRAKPMVYGSGEISCEIKWFWTCEILVIPSDTNLSDWLIFFDSSSL